MRPIRMTVSAFGPFAEEVQIDFEKLGNQGLYLITGDTGAGKTTIFDAIIFALYGEASGGYRESTMFRSKYARPERKTFVELVFSYNNVEYTDSYKKYGFDDYILKPISRNKLITLLEKYFK